ncbi:hypothetical protein [Cellvibrio sp. UBA7661]|uniref:hypothetical protein n=1 Tax=Cellvibrio sp. UBA7661 TaxID=1946311 RepID=UPI002F35ED1A
MAERPACTGHWKQVSQLDSEVTAGEKSLHIQKAHCYTLQTTEGTAVAEAASGEFRCLLPIAVWAAIGCTGYVGEPVLAATTSAWCS